MWDEALVDSDGFTHLYLDIFPEASLAAFKKLEQLKETIFNRAKSPLHTSSPNKKTPKSTTFGGDHNEYKTNDSGLHTSTSQGSKSKANTKVAENTEQLGDLSVEKGDLGVENDFIAEE
ncbi:hypothetical protein FRX31_029783, partial [Thalictrum thalictroides]